MTTTDLVTEFRKVPQLADLADDELQWLADHSEEVVLGPGEILIREGTPADEMIIYLEGEADARRESLGPDAPVYTLRAPQISGMLPFSRMTHFMVTSRTVTHTRLARISKDLFPEMLNRIPTLGPKLVGILSDRLGS